MVARHLYRLLFHVVRRLCTASLLVSSAAFAAPHKLALLVGVGQFGSSGIPQLEGPASDVAAIQKVLVESWGFAPGDVQTLVNNAATKSAILQAIASLQRKSQPGDEIIIFMSGHGTSSLDSGHKELALPHTSGAFVPYDFDLSKPNPVKGLLVGRYDLVPALRALEQGGRHVLVVSDSCYSGNQVRAVHPPGDPLSLPARLLPLPSPEKLKDLAAHHSNRTDETPPPYPYQSTVYLSAASEGEQAKDIPQQNLPFFPTLDGQPHGALTDAFLRVLTGNVPADVNGDGLLSLNEIQEAVADFMAGRGYGQVPHRLPAVSEDITGMGAQPVLGTPNLKLPRRQDSVQAIRIREKGLPPDVLSHARTLSGIQLVPKAPFDLAYISRAGQTALVTPSCDLVAQAPKNDPQSIMALIKQQAWISKFRAIATQSARASLAAEISPNHFGGSFKVGEKLELTARPDTNATLLALDVDTQGTVNIVSQTSATGLGNVTNAHDLYSTGKLDVQLPLGTDAQFIFAFDTAPKGLQALPQRAPVDDPRWAVLERILKESAGHMTFKQTEFRTLSTNDADNLAPESSMCP